MRELFDDPVIAAGFAAMLGFILLMVLVALTT